MLLNISIYIKNKYKIEKKIMITYYDIKIYSYYILSMGIPYYFSYIIKNYGNIIKKFQKNVKVDKFFLDSNSIVYDALFNVEYKGDSEQFEKEIIEFVCEKIKNYIDQISPKKLAYIAFDGVAPVAKLDQQRSRRYKSWYQSRLKNASNWDRTAITPGTKFMNKLNTRVEEYLKKNKKKLSCKEIIFSGSDKEGEGEHKIFEYIRNNKGGNVVVYGLDADLIMLSINHVPHVDNIYLFRETPEFIKSLDDTLDPNELYILEIENFKRELIYYMNGDKIPKGEQEINKIHDYIFITFMLGNDFMPHFPALNIRTNGIDTLMECYRNVIGEKGLNITNGNQIYWKNYRKLVMELARHEEMYLQTEYKTRNKMEKRVISSYHEKDEDERLLSCPCVEREVEKYINPFDEYWEARYYDMLMDIDYRDKEAIKKLCLNYIEGLEWTFKYYSEGCVDWRWTYRYSYPPLLKDLQNYIPYFDTDMLDKKPKNSVRDMVQLSYVIPKTSLNLLPPTIRDKLLAEYSEMYSQDYEFQWAFCKYFWESHVEFPEIDLKRLEVLVNS